MHALEAQLARGGVLEHQEQKFAASKLLLQCDPTSRAPHPFLFALLRSAEDWGTRVDVLQTLARSAGPIDDPHTQIYDAVFEDDSVDVVPPPETVGIDPVAGALRFYPDLGATVDVMEIVRALAQIGLRPTGIVVETEPPR